MDTGNIMEDQLQQKYDSFESMGWINVSEKKPPLGLDIEVWYSENEIYDDIIYIESRVCMMAGIAGGHGYFGEGFATNGINTDYGLIVDEPKFWRPLKIIK